MQVCTYRKSVKTYYARSTDSEQKIDMYIQETLGEGDAPGDLAWLHPPRKKKKKPEEKKIVSGQALTAQACGWPRPPRTKTEKDRNSNKMGSLSMYCSDQDR